MCTVVGGCNAGEAQCTDSFAYEVCGLESASATQRTFGPRIPCWDGNSCSSGSCSGQCGLPEVLLVVDRSSSMQGARWDFVRAAIVEFAEMNQSRASFGLRMFPSGGGCGVGGIVPIAPFNAGQVVDGLDAPSTDSQTPIGAALDGVTSAFGDPNEGQAVVLITDGDETCSSDPNEAVLQAEILARSGVQTYVIGVSNMANPTLLADIASAGRSGAHAFADDGPAVFNALGSVLSALDVCQTGTGGIGDSCATAGDCTGGVCLTNEVFTWPGGYCSQICDPAPCPNGSSCTVSPLDPNTAICLKSCTIPEECRLPEYNCNTNVCVPGI
jgi:hypothetical protein